MRHTIEIALAVAVIAMFATGIIMAVCGEPRKVDPRPTRSTPNNLGQIVTYIPSMRDFDTWVSANRHTKIISIAFPHHVGGAYVVHECAPETKP